MNNPKISIIIRTKNEEKYISQCLKKISQQTLKEFDSIEGWATYVSSSNQDESRDQAIDKSIDMVVQELIDTSTSSW